MKTADEILEVATKDALLLLAFGFVTFLLIMLAGTIWIRVAEN